MLALAKVACLVLLAILAFALSSEGRELLDYYGDCYGGKNLQTSALSRLTPCHLCFCCTGIRFSRPLPLLCYAHNALSRADNSYLVLNTSTYGFGRSSCVLHIICRSGRVRRFKTLPGYSVVFS